MRTIVRFKKGKVANKIACVVDIENKTCEVSFRGHKLKVIFNDNNTISVIEE